MNSVIDTIADLRTVHGDFSGERIDDATLQTILTSSVRAANASARQSYSMVVLDDREAMRRVCGYESDRLIVYCVDFNRIDTVGRSLGYTKPCVDFVQFLTAAIDTSLVAQTAALAARSLGVDSLFTNGIHRAPMDTVFSVLGLPERYCFPLIALALGYAKSEPLPPHGRLCAEGVVHYGKYAPLSAGDIDGIVAAYDDPERRLGMDVDWQKQGYSHYLDWFHSKWHGATAPEKIREIDDRLRKSGFIA